ncbi:MAG: T9SS type A sorting domain-containing protein [Bacteroidia bacterium]|nr:T9SS type A sorting domain-containing protein [Bacteroidia bacterium]
MQEGVNKFSWNGLSKIQAGIYFLKITGATHTEIIKLIKQ